VAFLVARLFEMERPTGGFQFDLAARNKFLETSVQNAKIPAGMKTGTTICGCIFKDGVAIAADSRATEGNIVADKNCMKIHYLAPNIYACGAGTSADCDNVTEMISSNLTLHRLSTGRPNRVSTAVTMLSRMLYRYQGHISTALVIGGVDCTGSHLYTVHPHGSVDKLPYVTMGSGCLAAMSIFESEYREGLDTDQARDLVRACISAGIYNDLGSGSNCNVCIIKPDGAKILRNVDKIGDKWKSPAGFSVPAGTTDYVDEHIKQIKKFIVVEDASSMAS
jgi:20S proteasome subunit beta 2